MALPEDIRRAKLDDVRRTFELFHEDGGIVELRVLDVPRIRMCAGYFDDPGAFVAAARQYSGPAGGVYVTLNAVPPVLLARAVNRTVPGLKHTTTDDDIGRRRWLLIDCDARRPAGMSSTDAEHQAALERAQAVQAWLVGQDVPEAALVLADSGNGAHVLVRVDLPNDAAAKALVDGVLAALDFRFGDAAVTIDRKVGNAARITKVYGTWVAKGDATADRPHRLSRLLVVPNVSIPCPQEMLTAIAAQAPPTAPPVTRRRRGTTGGAAGAAAAELADDELTAWLTEHGLEVASCGPWGDGHKWVLATCPWNEAHTDQAAYVVRFANGAIAAGCHHDGCHGMGWADLRLLFEPGGDGPSHGGFGGPDAAPPGEGPTNVMVLGPRAPRLVGEHWPKPPAAAAYHGLAGRVVAAADPHTEGDRVAVLVSFLTTFGCLVGPGPHAVVGATRHTPRLFTGIVGRTAKARKGDSWQPVRVVLRAAFAGPDLGMTVQDGLTSGEGLIWAVRDPIEKLEPIKQHGRVVDYQPVKSDPGVEDKRLLVVEPELGRVLQAMSRQGNTLSAVLRTAWDTGDLNIMTKTNAAHATGAHVALLGHITLEELRRDLPDIEGANGFANRFLWVLVRRSKELPEPVPFAGEVVDHLGMELARAVQIAQGIEQVERDPEARALVPAVSRTLGGAAGAGGGGAGAGGGERPAPVVAVRAAGRVSGGAARAPAGRPGLVGVRRAQCGGDLRRQDG